MKIHRLKSIYNEKPHLFAAELERKHGQGKRRGCGTRGVNKQQRAETFRDDVPYLSEKMKIRSEKDVRVGDAKWKMRRGGTVPPSKRRVMALPSFTVMPIANEWADRSTEVVMISEARALKRPSVLCC